MPGRQRRQWRAMTQPPARPLDGILVVALEQAVAAPLASCRLSDAGARVIKLERDGGDFARGYDTAANGQSALLRVAEPRQGVARRRHQGARRPRPRDCASSSEADVFIQNLAVGAAARSGLGSDDSAQAFPAAHHMRHLRLRRDRSVRRHEGLRPPCPSRSGSHLDQRRARANTAAWGYRSATTPPAFRRCSRSTKRWSNESAHRLNGSAIKVSLFDVLAELMSVPLLQHDYTGAGPERIGLAHPSITPYGGFVTKDRATLVISVQNDREWASLVTKVLDRPELVDDPLYATNPARMERRAEVDGLVQAFFSLATTARRWRPSCARHASPTGQSTIWDDLSRPPPPAPATRAERDRRDRPARAPERHGGVAERAEPAAGGRTLGPHPARIRNTHQVREDHAIATQAHRIDGRRNPRLPSQREKTLIIVSNGHNGYPHPMPMWFDRDHDGCLYCTTFGKSQKVQELAPRSEGDAPCRERRGVRGVEGR